MLDREHVRKANPIENVITDLLGQPLSHSGARQEAVAICPWHDDQRPSLRVNAEKQAWYCDPCGTGGDVFTFVERHRQTDFRGALAWLADRAGIATAADDGIVEAYDYHDEDGNLLFQVCRLGSASGVKRFRQRRPDGTGGWVWNVKGVRSVPYQLPKLLAADPAAPVYVPEGEKDVDALWRLGLVATCNPGGAGKWRSEFNAYLASRTVVVLPDNDECGKKHGLQVAQSLFGVDAVKPVIDVKMVTLPNLPPKGDVSDWIQAGGTGDALQQIVAAAPAWTPPSGPVAPADDDAVARLNKKHAVVREGGKTVVINEEYDRALSRPVITRSSFADFRHFYDNERVEVGRTKRDEPIYKPLGSYWLKDAARRQFEGVVFEPGHNVPGHFNLWRGFAAEPREGDWSRMRTHLYEIVCGGNTELFDYVMAWLAHGVQQPGRAAEVALVMQGARGTGKGIFARSYGELFGHHFVHVSRAKHLTGHFNAHLQDTVVVFADEAFFPGDKQSEGALKTLITEPTIAIERKGRDVVVAKNCVHLIVASNHDWVVPAGLDERRFCVLSVDDGVRQDHEYFKRLASEVDGGGREAMLWELLRHDVSQVDLRRAPMTSALQEQKLLSMQPNGRWWHQKLWDGQLLPEHGRWEPEVMKEAVYRDYASTLAKAGVSRKSLSTELGVFLNRMVPAGSLRSFKKTAKVPVSWGREDDGRARQLPHWGFPPLDDCRAAFEAITGNREPWPQEESK